VLPILLAVLALEPVFVLLAVGHGGAFERISREQLLLSPSFSLTQVGPAQVGPEKVSPQDNLAEVILTQAMRAQVSIAQVGPAQVAMAHLIAAS
jgi:hypothetical protein